MAIRTDSKGEEGQFVSNADQKSTCFRVLNARCLWRERPWFCSTLAVGQSTELDADVLPTLACHFTAVCRRNLHDTTHLNEAWFSCAPATEAIVVKTPAPTGTGAPLGFAHLWPDPTRKAQGAAKLRLRKAEQIAVFDLFFAKRSYVAKRLPRSPRRLREIEY